MKTKLCIRKKTGLFWVVLPLLLIVCFASAAETGGLREPEIPNLQTNLPAASPETGPKSQVPEAQPMAIPHLQPRKSSGRLAPQDLSSGKNSSAQMRQANRPLATPSEMNRGARPGSPPGPPHDPRLTRAHDPRQPQTGRMETVPQNLPSSLVKRYDANKDGKLDSVEWFKSRQDMENRLAEKERLRAVTNAVPAAAAGSTNKPIATP